MAEHGIQVGGHQCHLLVDVAERPSELGPPRKSYTLNDTGRRELAGFWERWDYLSSRIDELKEDRS